MENYRNDNVIVDVTVSVFPFISQAVAATPTARACAGAPDAPAPYQPREGHATEHGHDDRAR